MTSLSKSVSDALVKVFGAEDPLYFRLKEYAKEPIVAWKDPKKRSCLPPLGGKCTSYGIALPEGIVVVDLDSPESEEFIKKFDGVFDTFIQKTPRGKHLFFRADAEILDNINQRAKILGHSLDIRIGGKGFVVGPDSQVRQDDGSIKTYIIDPTGKLEIAPIPKSLLDEIEEQNAPAPLLKTTHIKEKKTTRAKSRPGTKKAPRAKGKGRSKVLDIASDVDTKVQEGERNQNVFDFARVLAKGPLPNDKVLDAARTYNKDNCDPPLADFEVKKIVSSTIAYHRKGQDRNGIAVEFSKSWATLAENCFTAMGFLFGVDDLSGRICMMQEPAAEWWDKYKEMTDDDYAAVECAVNSHCVVCDKEDDLEMKFVNIPHQRMMVAIRNNAHRNRFDPIRKYLEDLPSWDGVPRIETSLYECFNIDDKEHRFDYIKWAGWNLWGGLVNRGLNPAAEHHEALVLIGDGGCGKSSFVKNILPTNKWLNPSFIFQSNTTNMVRQIVGKWLVECAEMIGSKRLEAEHKAFLTVSEDWYDEKYENKKSNRRRTIFVGTTNDPNCLPDDKSGANRRYIPIKVSNDPSQAYSIIVGYLTANREQLFAEAKYKLSQGVPLSVPPSLRQYHHDRTNAHRDKSELMYGLVEDAVRYCGNGAKIKQTELLEAMQIDAKAFTSDRRYKQMKSILEEMGYERVRASTKTPDGERVKAYFWVFVD